MNKTFTIKYRSHWCGPCEQYGDTKTETVINSDGSILARRYDHQGQNGHYRVTERASGAIAADDAARLYEDLLDLITHREFVASACDVIEEILLEEPGMKISVDGGLTSVETTASAMIGGILRSVDLQWEVVTPPKMLWRCGTPDLMAREIEMKLQEELRAMKEKQKRRKSADA